MTNNDTVEWRLLGTNLTTVLAILPAADSHLYLELNEPGSGNLKIPLTSTAAGQVTSGMFCECYYRGASRGGFFVDNLKEVNADGAEAGGKWMSISGRGALALLEDAIVWDNGSDTTERTFTGQTRGYIMKTLIDEAKARGGLSALSYNFSATLDSASASWTDSDDYEFPVGSSLLDVLREFSADGTDFTIALSAGSFVLSAWQADYGTDRSSTIYMRVGSNCEEVSKDQRGEPIKNVIRVKHKGGYITVTDSTSITSNRRREMLLNLEAAQSGSSASTYASVRLNNVKNPQISLAVRVYDGVNPRLFVDYNIGDTVTIDKQGTQISYRVLGVQIDFSEKQFADVTLETNSIIRENELNFERDINSLLKRWNTARDSDQTEVMQWMPIGGDALGYVYDSFIDSGELYICGNFTGISGKLTATNKVLKYVFSSGVWSAVGDTSSFATDPRRIQVTTDGVIYAMNTTEVWRKIGSGSWTRIGLTTGGPFRDMILWDSNDPNYSGVVVGGVFTDTSMGVGVSEGGGLSVYDGTTWRNLQVLMPSLISPYGLAKNGTSLMIGGFYSLPPDKGDIKGLRSDLTSYNVFATTTGRNPIRSIHFSATNALTYIDTTGKIYQGTVTPGTPHDSFTNIGTVDTFTDSEIITGIYSYLNDIYIHGYMDGVDGVVSHSVVRYSGGNWESVDAGTTGTGDFISTVIFNGDNMIVGGQFDTMGGITIEQLAIHIVDFADLIDMISKAGSMDHNSLNGIQGGSSNSYYHLTSTQHTDLTDSGDSTLHYHASDRSSANFTGTNWTDLTDGGGTTLHTHAYTALTSKPAAETNANDIFRCDTPGGTSAFAGTIATLPGGATLTYNVTSGNEGAMVPTSTSQLAKVRVYNTTRGTSALISNCVTGTNTITLTANVPAGWAVTDVITIASQTVTGGGLSWIDLEITSSLVGKVYLFIKGIINSATASDFLRAHPLDASFSTSKYFLVPAVSVANVQVWDTGLVTLANNVFSIAWSGTPSYIIAREMGYLE